MKHDPTAGAALLRECVADLIGVAPGEVDLARTFAELGVESLGALKLRRALAAKCGEEVPLTAFLGENPAFRVLESLTGSAGAAPPPAPVIPVEPGEPVALTPVQGAYWAGRGTDFALGGVATFWYHEYDRETADIDVLESAFARLVAGHPMLRTTIGRDGFQRENAEVPPFRIERTDLRGMRTEDAESALAELRHRLSRQVRPPHEWPLFDVRAALLPGGGARVFVGFDVLILDFASWRLLMTQWGRLVADPEAALPAPPAAFLDIVRHRETDPGYQARRDRDRAYWSGRALPAGPRLPVLDIAEPRFRRRQCRLDAVRWAALRARAAERGLSPTSVLLAAFGLVLHRWGATEPFALNATLFDRPDNARDVVGDFTTTALVAMPAPASFVDYARKTNETLWEAIDHCSYTGVEVRRETGHAYPVVFTSGIGIGDGTAPAGWLGEEVFGVSQTPQVLLDHLVWEEDGAVRLVWDAVEAAFPDGYLDGLAGAEYTLLTRLAEDDLAWTAADLGWDPTFAAPEPLDVTPFGDCGPLLDAPLRLAADRTPEAPAVIAPGERLSHGELAARASALAGSLAAAGVSAGDLVLVALPKSAEQIAAVLAVLRCGAGYVPVDPAWPAARIAAVCSRAGITRAVVAGDVPLPPGVTTVDTTAGDVPVGEADPDDLAYVIFTSGSTGVPKGVAIEHRQARTTVDDITDRFGITSADRVLALSALSFDLSVYDIFGVLGAGGAMVLPDPARQRDPQHWCELVEAHGVTVWNTAPALLEMVVEYAESDPAARLGSLRLVLLSGDWIPVSLPDRLRALVPGARVMSLGGATEASIWSITHPIGSVDPEWPSIPYGRPLRGQGFHVLDEAGRPCPVGEPGELFIAGAGVARGYIGDAAQTAERFAVHPVLGERLYRTGDLGRWRTDGTIQFLGRTDRQVKIRGHRVELGEIESALDRLPQVRQAVAAAAPGPDGRPRLVAYVVLAEPCAERELAARLGEAVPDYMVPTRFVLLDAMPVTANGKVDHQALPNPFRRTPTPELSRESSAETVTPDRFHAKAPHVAVGEVVRGVLGDVDFGLGLIAAGASSLDVVRLANALEDATGTRPSFTELVAHPSIEDMVRACAGSRPSPETPAGLPDPGGLVLAMRLERPEARPLADALADAGRWLRELHDWAGHHGYRVEESLPSGGRDLVEVRLRGEETTGPFPLTEMQLAYLVGRADTWLGDAVAPHYYTEVDVLDLDPDRLAAALRTVIARHPMLRATITPDTLQTVRDAPPPCRVDVFDLRGRPDEALRIREERSHRVLDPAGGPLLHVAAGRLDDRTWRVHFGLDLLFCDAQSAVVLADELVTAYHDPARLAAPPAATFRQWVTGRAEVPEESRAYWRRAAAEMADGPALPVRAPGPGKVRFTRRHAEIEAARWEALCANARRHGVTPAGLLLSALADTLHAGGGGDRFTLVVTSFDRPAGHEGVIGDYTSTVLLDVDRVAGSHADRARSVQRRLLADLEHGQVHGNEVLRELAARRGGQVLLPVVFSSGLGSTRTADGASADASRLLSRFGRTEYAISQTPHVVLDCQVFEAGGTLRINWDAVEAAFPDGYLDALFAAFVAAAGATEWDEPDPAGLAARGLTRGPVPASRPMPRQRTGSADPAMEQRIARVLGGLLGVPAAELDPLRTFFELGATSLTLVRAHRELAAGLDRPVTVLDLFAHPSIRELAAYLAPAAAETGDDVLAAARSRGRARRGRLETSR
ncbi:amino acid adenylation domain-containing protein [Amycolatopsis sp. NPDC021455]|uniref:amino acid adenylation domain-containing protein n=1 Tax=Amycolatopsis sp. NPDC021455 TaxID=3154901 RepID=UPI0033E33E0C